jgi:hypothetical protein
MKLTSRQAVHPLLEGHHHLWGAVAVRAFVALAELVLPALVVEVELIVVVRSVVVAVLAASEMPVVAASASAGGRLGAFRASDPCLGAPLGILGEASPPLPPVDNQASLVVSQTLAFAWDIRASACSRQALGQMELVAVGSRAS